MNIVVNFVISLLIGSSLLLTGIGDVEAKRLGGDNSSSSSPVRLSTNPKSSTQRQASVKNQAMRQSLSRRGGLMGMLGGLALGGLLGSLLFGGAFENVNFFDITVFGLIGYLIHRFLGRNRGAANPAYPSAGSAAATQDRELDLDSPMERQTTPTPASRRSAAGFDVDLLFENRGPAPDVSKQQFNDYSELPEDFEEDAFLEGAKIAYKRLQAAWDAEDLADILALTSDKFFAELQDQSKAQKGIKTTDILKVDAELLLVNDNGTQKEATVLFDAILREPDDRSEQGRGIWHFVRDNSSRKPTWFLDGIQQMDD